MSDKVKPTLPKGAVIEVRNSDKRYEQVAQLPSEGHIRIIVRKRPSSKK